MALLRYPVTLDKHLQHPDGLDVVHDNWLYPNAPTPYRPPLGASG